MNICRNCNCVGSVRKTEKYINGELVKVLKCLNCRHEAEAILKTKKIKQKDKTN